jgi:hypothetical protein
MTIEKDQQESLLKRRQSNGIASMAEEQRGNQSFETHEIETGQLRPTSSRVGGAEYLNGHGSIGLDRKTNTNLVMKSRRKGQLSATESISLGHKGNTGRNARTELRANGDRLLRRELPLPEQHNRESHDCLDREWDDAPESR